MINIHEISNMKNIFSHQQTHYFRQLFIHLIFLQLFFISNAYGYNEPSKKSPSSDMELILYHSENTRNFYVSVGANEQLLTSPWKKYAAQHRIKLTEINHLDELNKKSNSILILASTLALDDQEKSHILKYQQQGGAIVSTWATGSRDGSGQWVGWSFLKELAGAEVVRELPADGSENYAVTRGEGPLTHALPAGHRIWLGRIAERPFLMRGAPIAAWGLNWTRQVQANGLTEGLVLHSERGGPVTHRVAVLGFAETSWEYQLSDMHQLITGTLSWLNRTPVTLKANWPKGKIAAYMVGMDTEEKFQNSTYLIEQFSKFNYKGSFYLLTSEAIKYPEIIQNLEKNKFDLNYHGDIHNSFKNQSPALMKERIDRMISQLSSVMVTPTVGHGFRAPTEGFDPDIHPILYQAGIRHHLADPNQGNGRLPFFAPLEEQKKGDQFVILPRTTRDDFNLQQDAGSNPGNLAQLMIDDFESARSQGAFGALSLHSHLVAADTALGQAFPDFLRYAKAQSSVWLASGQDIAKWWNERDRYRIEKLTPSEITISIAGSDAFENAGLIFILKHKNKLPTIQPKSKSTPQPLLTRLDDYRALLLPGNLSPGMHRYQIQQ